MSVVANPNKTGVPGASSYLLAQSAVPVILPSSGTSNATGQITLTTALPYQPSGTVGLYLPTGVVTAGSQGTGAGVYQVTFSSTTVCQLTGTGITSANAAYTQTTAADLTLASITVPGGALGLNGAISITTQHGHPNNANNKSIKHILGAGVIVSAFATITTNTFSEIFSIIRSRGAAAVNTSFQAWVQGGTNLAIAGTSASGTGGQTTLDLSSNQTLTLTGNLAVATDYFILDGYTVEVLPF